MTAPIIIIGSGLAGYTLAREFRKLDQQTPLQIITADDGTYYSKPQLSSAFTHKKSAQALGGASAEKMAQQLNAEVLPHTVVKDISATERMIYTERQALPYSRLILAQGAEVIKATITGKASQEIVSVNNLEDYQKFRTLVAEKKRLAILGAGLVGCEFTNDLLNGGFQIDVIALAKSPLDILLPPQLGKTLQTVFAQNGIKWHLGHSIQTIDYAPNGDLSLLLTSSEEIIVEAVLSAIGLRPVVQLAQTANVITKKGIVVDKYLQTSDPNIYALGDCAEVAGYVMFYVAPLVICARALAATLSGQRTAVSYPPMPIVIKTPSCPVVVNPPPPGLAGEWQISGEFPDQKGLFYDTENKLQGFALVGKTVLEKLALTKELSNLF